jgi:hypothetical protein
VADISEHDVIDEDVHFALPREVRRPIATGTL